MSVNLFAGIRRLHLIYTTRYDPIREDDVRDDLLGIKIWISTIPGFDFTTIEPLEFGTGSTVSIDDLEVNTQYYLRYAFISKIDPETYTVSQELTAKTYDEATRVYGELTNDPVYLSRQSGSTNINWTPVTGVFRVVDLNTEVTGANDPVKGPVYSIVPNSATNGIEATINPVTGEYYATGWSGITRTGKVTFKAVYDGIEVLRDWDLVDGIGQDAPQLRLSLSPDNFIYVDENATLSSVPQVTAVASLTNITGTPVFTVQGYSVNGTLLGNIPFTQLNNTITVTNQQFHINNNISYAVIRAELGTVFDSDTINRLNNGTSAITVDVSNPVVQLQADEFGTVDTAEYAESGTEIEVYEGATKLPVSATLSASPSWRIINVAGYGITPDPTELISTYVIAYDRHDEMLADTATIEYTIQYKTKAGLVGTKVVKQQFAKSKQGSTGEKGDPGDPGTQGSPGPSIEISGLGTFYRNAGGLISPANSTLQAILLNITNPSYSWSITGATPATATGSSVTITPTGASSHIVVRLTVTGSNLAQSITIDRIVSLVEQGAAGQAGQNGTMGAYPTIYQWTSGSAPARPTTTSTYTWSTGSYTAPSGSGWANTAPVNTSPGWVLWSITVPLTVEATTTTSTLDWTNTAYSIRASTANGTNGTAGTPGSATFLINRGSTNSSSQPTDAEVVAAINRSAQLGDIATISYNSGNNSVAYRATSSGTSATWALQVSYITGSLIVENTITGSKIVANSITSQQIDTTGLTIRDTNGNIILNAGTGVFTGNVTGSINGTSASTVVSTANSAQATANSANTAASAAQTTANSASTAASTAQATADAAKTTADAATASLANKLNSNARNVLSGSGGLATGTLNWNSSGVRNSGYGVGITANGIVAYNSSGQPTFVLDGATGSATFSGHLSAATGSFSGNLTGTIDGTSASTVVSTANSAQATANSASTAASTAQATANSASTAASAAQTTANSASTAASTAQTTANTAKTTADTAKTTADTAKTTADAAKTAADAATAGLANKLSSNARNVLSGSGGLATGTLNWNSSGVRSSGYGIGITANGIVAYNSSGQPTFVLNGSTGAATFSGQLSAATGTFAGSLSAATGTFSGTLSAASGSFSGNLTAQTITTSNIVNQAVSQVYIGKSTTTGSSASINVVIPSGASGYVITVGFGTYGTAKDPDQIAQGIVYISGSQVVRGTGTAVYAGETPAAGTYTVSATRSSGGAVFETAMFIVVQILKR